MKKLLAIALLALSTTFGHAEAVDLENLIFAGQGIYSDEIPIPVIYACYDTDGDGKEDLRAVYQIKNGHTKLVAKYVDKNRDGFFEDDEKEFIVDLEKEYGQSKGNQNKPPKSFLKQPFNLSSNSFLYKPSNLLAL